MIEGMTRRWMAPRGWSTTKLLVAGLIGLAVVGGLGSAGQAVVQFLVFNTAQTTANFVTSGSLTINTWHMATGTLINASSNAPTLSLYIDGVLAGSTTGNQATITTDSCV